MGLEAQKMSFEVQEMGLEAQEMSFEARKMGLGRKMKLF